MEQGHDSQRAILSDHGIIQSMSKKADCSANHYLAPVELERKNRKFLKSV